MSWIAITVETLKGFLNAATVDAVNTRALGDGEVNRFDEVQPGVIALIRGAIGSRRGNILDPDKTKIPASLKNTACALIIEAIQPAIMELNEDQRRAGDNARKLLDKIAAGTFVVEDVDTAPDEFQSGIGTPQMTEKCLNFQRRNQDGI